MRKAPIVICLALFALVAGPLWAEEPTAEVQTSAQEEFLVDVQVEDPACEGVVDVPSLEEGTAYELFANAEEPLNPDSRVYCYVVDSYCQSCSGGIQACTKRRCYSPTCGCWYNTTSCTSCGRFC
ncbi:MAG: hypothetical protein AAGD06_06260 [Acidobacteriota bacterium]